MKYFSVVNPTYLTKKKKSSYIFCKNCESQENENPNNFPQIYLPQGPTDGILLPHGVAIGVFGKSIFSFDVRWQGYPNHPLEHEDSLPSALALPGSETDLLLLMPCAGRMFTCLEATGEKVRRQSQGPPDRKHDSWLWCHDPGLDLGPTWNCHLRDNWWHLSEVSSVHRSLAAALVFLFDHFPTVR